MTTFINAPKQCDICENEFEGTMYDARTTAGSWGNLCEQCFREYGVGLGIGRGQMYQRLPGGKWVKEEG